MNHDSLLVQVTGGPEDAELVRQAREYADDRDLDVTLCRVFAVVDRTFKRSTGEPILPWETMRNQEVQAIHELARLRDRYLRGRTRSATMQVRFGDEVDEVMAAARAEGVQAMMTTSRRSRFGLRDRSDRLRGRLAVPLLMVQPAGGPDSTGPFPISFGSLTAGDKVTAVGRLPLFADLPRKQHEAMARSLDEIRMDGGVTLLQEGRMNSAMWLVIEGRLEVSRGGRHVRDVEAPGLVGVPSMLDGGPAWATVRTRTAIRALVASAAQVRALCASQPVALRLWAETGATLRKHILATAAEPP